MPILKNWLLIAPRSRLFGSMYSIVSGKTISLMCRKHTYHDNKQGESLTVKIVGVKQTVTKETDKKTSEGCIKMDAWQSNTGTKITTAENT